MSNLTTEQLVNLASDLEARHNLNTHLGNKTFKVLSITPKGDSLTLTFPCAKCETHIDLTAPVTQWWLWADGAFIQEALTVLTVDERDLIMTAWCQACSDQFYNEFED